MSPTPRFTPSSSLRTPWSRADDAYLQVHYNSDHAGQVHAIAQHLGRTSHAVKRRAGLLGLRRPRPQQRWTREEEQFLNNYTGTLLTTSLAKRLKRSVSAVTHKCRQLQLRNRCRDGYTLDDLVTCFGAAPPTIHRWVHDGKLQIQHRGTHRPHDAWRVTEDAILCFIEHHPMAFDLHRVDQLWFLDLLFDSNIITRALRARASDTPHTA